MSPTPSDFLNYLHFMLDAAYKYAMDTIQRLFGSGARTTSTMPALALILTYVRMFMPQIRSILSHLQQRVVHVVHRLVGMLMSDASSNTLDTILVYLRGIVTTIMGTIMHLVHRLLGAALSANLWLARLALVSFRRIPPFARLMDVADPMYDWLNSLLEVLLKMFMDMLKRYFGDAKAVQTAVAMALPTQ